MSKLISEYRNGFAANEIIEIQFPGTKSEGQEQLCIEVAYHLSTQGEKGEMNSAGN